MSIIYVGQGEYLRARNQNILCSGGVGPCIAVGALTRIRAYMCHTDTDAMEELDSLLRDLQRERLRPSQVRIYVVGGSPHFDAEYEPHVDLSEILADAERLLDTAQNKIFDAGFRDSIVEVQSAPNATFELTLDVAEQCATISEIADEE